VSERAAGVIRVVLEIRRRRSIPVIVLVRLAMLARCIVLVVCRIFVDVRLSSTFVRGVLPNIWPVVCTVRIIIPIICGCIVRTEGRKGRRCRKHRIRVERELRKNRTWNLLARSKLGVQILRDGGRDVKTCSQTGNFIFTELGLRVGGR
jgi:hypothetical protein